MHTIHMLCPHCSMDHAIRRRILDDKPFAFVATCSRKWGGCGHTILVHVLGGAILFDDIHARAEPLTAQQKATILPDHNV
jgi:hypothetical protein